MAKHECCKCRHMNGIEDAFDRTFYLCTFPYSPCFLEEVGHCCECELDETSEEWYQNLEG